MLIILAQIFSILFTILVAVKSYLDYRAKKESLTMMIFWVATWLTISAVAFFPQLVDSILGKSHARAGVGTILGIGLIFIYFVIYRVYVKADRVEKQLNKLIRNAALRDQGKAKLRKKNIRS